MQFLPSSFGILAQSPQVCCRDAIQYDHWYDRIIRVNGDDHNLFGVIYRFMPVSPTLLIDRAEALRLM